jgi:hypothetical protein
MAWSRIKSAFIILYTSSAKIVWILVGFLVLAVIVQDFTTDVIRIAPISVPKSFSESGYTPEVATAFLGEFESKGFTTR